MILFYPCLYLVHIVQRSKIFLLFSIKESLHLEIEFCILSLSIFGIIDVATGFLRLYYVDSLDADEYLPHLMRWT